MIMPQLRCRAATAELDLRTRPVRSVCVDAYACRLSASCLVGSIPRRPARSVAALAPAWWSPAASCNSLAPTNSSGSPHANRASEGEGRLRVSIVNEMLKFSDDEAVQKAACRSLLNLTPSVEGDEYQKIRSQDGALAQSIFYAICEDNFRLRTAGNENSTESRRQVNRKAQASLWVCTTVRGCVWGACERAGACHRHFNAMSRTTPQRARLSGSGLAAEPMRAPLACGPPCGICACTAAALTGGARLMVCRLWWRKTRVTSFKWR
jgi:hypothetical protein